MDKNISIEKIIEEEIKKNLNIKITTDYYGYVNVELLYKNMIISVDDCQVTTDSNPLDD